MSEIDMPIITSEDVAVLQSFIKVHRNPVFQALVERFLTKDIGDHEFDNLEWNVKRDLHAAAALYNKKLSALIELKNKSHQSKPVDAAHITLVTDLFKLKATDAVLSQLIQMKVHNEKNADVAAKHHVKTSNLSRLLAKYTSTEKLAKEAIVSIFLK